MKKYLLSLFLIASCSPSALIGMGHPDDDNDEENTIVCPDMLTATSTQPTTASPSPSQDNNLVIKVINPALANQMLNELIEHNPEDEWYPILKEQLFEIDELVRQKHNPILMLQDAHGSRAVYAIKETGSGTYMIFGRMYDETEIPSHIIFTTLPDMPHVSVAPAPTVGSIFYRFYMPTTKEKALFSHFLTAIKGDAAVKLKKKMAKQAQKKKK